MQAAGNRRKVSGSSNSGFRCSDSDETDRAQLIARVNEASTRTILVGIAGYRGTTGIGVLSDAGLSGLSSKQSGRKKKRSTINLLTMLLSLFAGELVRSGGKFHGTRKTVLRAAQVALVLYRGLVEFVAPIVELAAMLAQGGHQFFG